MTSQKQERTPIWEEQERLILKGLACEWENGLWVLDEPHRNLMQRPLLSLRDMTSKLGQWCSEKREISLSRNLVRNHSWDTIIEVLRHEMAHQFADDVLGAHSEPSHGPTFQRACNLLRANPKASGKCQPLHDRIFRESSSCEEKMMIRIRKLMALAQSQNQHEAEVAMAKAHQLIAKYNVDLIAQGENRDFVSIFVGRPALRHFREEYRLGGLLHDFYFVFGIWMPAYVIDKGKMGHVLEISGTVQNVKIAHYVYDYVQKFISSQWEEYNKGRGLNRYRKTDFAVGIIDGFRSKLESQKYRKKKAGDKRVLIKIEDALLNEYVQYKYPRIVSCGMRPLKRDRTVLANGINAGKTLVISKGITETGRSRPLLIEDKKE